MPWFAKLAVLLLSRHREFSLHPSAFISPVSTLGVHQSVWDSNFI
uniref:Uncharacterized protein n=1 Tax=Anguilla anguilla TaxID=7936 RepID=A0A0E9PPM1_ANGAN